MEEYKIFKKINDKTASVSNLKKYLKNDNDISTLIKSYISMDNNIKQELKEIKKTTAKKEKIETKLNIASNIQRNMIKTNFDEFSKGRGFEIYGFMNPAREVGGDFYDFFNIDNNNIAFVIGDVSGKGIPATLFMIKTMHLIENHSKFDCNLKETFENVNNLIYERNEEEQFTTSWLGNLNLENGKLTFVNAGHNQPLIKQNKKDFEYLNIKANFILGGMEDMPYKEHELILNPGDMIFLYTDGITEANNDYQGFYGEKRLEETINKYKNKSLENIVENIKNDVYEFCGDENLFDDITMLIVKYNGCENNE